MLSSSIEYLNALREGRYLQFLEWPQFLTAHYRDGATGCDADDTINLLIFEWLKNGFCEEDAKKIAVLVAISDLKNKPLRANLAYALNSISIALFQCMLYVQTKADKEIILLNKPKIQQIKDLITRPIEGVDKNSFTQLLKTQQQLFLSWVDKCDPIVVQEIAAPIFALTKLRYLAEEYVSSLEMAKLGDELYETRLSLVKSFATYLAAQTELSPGINETIQRYTISIKEKSPKPFEFFYLDQFTPSTLTTTILKSLGFITGGFFHLLHTPTATTTTDTKSTIILD